MYNFAKCLITKKFIHKNAAMDKNNLESLLARNQWETLFSELNTLTPDDENWRTQLLMLEGRYNTLKQQKILGTLSYDDAGIETNKIRNGVLSLINGIDTQTDVRTPNKPTNNSKKFFAFDNINAVVGLFAGLAGILTFYFSYCRKETGTDKPFTVVVYTHPKGNKQNILQLKETQLVMDIGGRREVSKVGDNGQNIFTEIASQFLGKKSGIGITSNEGYVLSFPDSMYVLNNEPIYLAVQSNCRFCKLTGFVRNASDIVKNAIVSTGNYSDTTKANGYFEINIPPAMEKEDGNYPVTVRLNNKIVWDKFITPNPKQPAEILIK